MTGQLDLEGFDVSVIKRKSVLILGDASGLGLSVGLELAKNGALVTIADSLPSSVVVEHFSSRELPVQYVKCNPKDWQELVVAFKQAINFASTRSLDAVCLIPTTESDGDLVLEAEEADPRVETVPEEVHLNDGNSDFDVLVNSIRLALHYFQVPPRPLHKKRPRLPSMTTLSSVSSRSGSRSRSPSPSRAGSSMPRSALATSSSQPLPPPPPPPPAYTSAQTAERVQNGNAETEASNEVAVEVEPEPVFAKSLIVVSDVAAFVGDTRNNAQSAVSFAIRGLFKSLRVKAYKCLNVRLNLVSPWLLDSDKTREILADMEEEGLISKVDQEPSTPKPESRESTSENAANSDVKADAKDEKQTLQAGQGAEPEPRSGTNSGEIEVVVSAVRCEATPVVAHDSNTVEKDNGDATTVANESQLIEITSEPIIESDPEKILQATSESSTNSEGPPQPEEIRATELPAEHQNSTVTETLGNQTQPATDSNQSTEPQSTKYNNIFFTDPSDVARTILRLCVDNSMYGRAIAVMPEGAFDLNDDHSGSYAGDQVKKLIDMRRQAGDIWLVE